MAPTLVLDDVDLELMAMIEAYQLQLNALADAAATAVRDAFLALPEVRDALLAEFERESRAIVLAARLEGADLASGLVSVLAGQTPKPVVLKFGDVAFDAPFLRTWHRLKEGDSFQQAQEAGASEAEIIGHNAAHDGAMGRMANTGLRVVGARRVLSPGACEWCQVLSVQRYHSVDAATFGHGGRHNKKNCKCSVVAIYGKRDPGRTLNKRRYADLKASGAPKRVAENTKRLAANRAAARSAALPAGTDTTDPRVQRVLNL
jgi:hypothetical protein